MSHPAEEDRAEDGSRLARPLEMIRRHGLWVLAAAAALPSLDLLALVNGTEAVKHATRLTPGDLVLAALAVCAAVEILRFHRPLPLVLKRAVAPLPAFAWVAVAAAAAAAASFGREGVQWKGALKEVVQLVEVLVVGYGWVLWAAPPAGDNNARENHAQGDGRRDLDRVLYALAGAVTVNVLFALAQVVYTEHVFHVRGLFEHRNALGTFLAVTLPVLAAAGVSSRRHWGVRVWLLVTAALGLCVTGNAGLFAAAAFGIIAAVVAVGAHACAGSRLPRFAHGLLAAAGVAIVALVIQPVLMPRLRDSQFRSVSTLPVDEHGRAHVSARVRRWGAALECVRVNPTLGVGPGQFQRRIGGFYDRFFERPAGRGDDVPGFDIRFDEPGSHSLYVVTAVEMGLLGLVAVGWFLASAVGRAAFGRSGFAAGALGSSVAVIVACLFSSVMVRGIALVFVIVLALGERVGESPASAKKPLS